MIMLIPRLGSKLRRFFRLLVMYLILSFAATYITYHIGFLRWKQSPGTSTSQSPDNSPTLRPPNTRTSPSSGITPSQRSPSTIPSSSRSAKPRSKIPGPSPSSNPSSSPSINPSPSPSHSPSLSPRPSPISSINTSPNPSSSLSPPRASPSPSPRRRPDPRFTALLLSRADASGFIILVMVDESFFDMATNMYEFSFRRNGINNFLFVGVGRTVCSLLAKISVPCFTFANDENSKTASRYGSSEFNQKVHIRTDIILDALDVNLTVLSTDVDVAFIKNPLVELKNLMKTAHFAAQWDHVAINSGFVVVRPSWLGRLIYETMRLKPGKADDQVALNNALREIKAIHRKNARLSNSSASNEARWIGIKMETAIVVLDKRRFVCGRVYFENPTYPLKSGIEWNPTDNCSNTPMTRGKFRPCADVVHNNWIIGKSAKVYRFRENLMWSYDPSGKYYGDRKAKYLAYRVDPAGNNKRQYIDISVQLAELKTALAFGHLLNRTVILKRFRCITGKSSPIATAECPLNALLDVSFFDNQFAGRYRESTFLMNNRVPAEVKRGLSAVQQCRTVPTNDEGDRQSDDVKDQNITVIAPQRPTSGDIVRRFSTFKDSVLLFDSFDYAECFPSFDDRSDGEQFALKLKLGFVRNNYLQASHERPH